MSTVVFCLVAYLCHDCCFIFVAVKVEKSISRRVSALEVLGLGLLCHLSRFSYSSCRLSFSSDDDQFSAFIKTRDD